MAAVEKFGTTSMVCDSYRHMQFFPFLSIYLINREWTKTQVSKSWAVVYRRKQQFSRERKGDSRMYFSVQFDATPDDRAVFSVALHDLYNQGRLWRVDFCINPHMYLCKHLSIACSRNCETSLNFCWSSLFHVWQNMVPRYAQKTRAFFASLYHTCLMLLAAVAVAADSGTKKHISLPCWTGSLLWSHHRIVIGSGSASLWLPLQRFHEASQATWVPPLTELWYPFLAQLRYLSMGIHCSPELSSCSVARTPCCCFRCSRYYRCC